MMIDQHKSQRLNSWLKRFNQTKSLYLFILPAIVFYGLFKYYPIYGSQIAFRDYSPFLGFWDSPWVGWDNFRRLFNSPDFVRIIRNTLWINMANLVFGFPVPIILAIMLNQLSSIRFKRTIQTITYAPYFISTVVLVGMLYTMLSPYSGVLNAIRKHLGLAPVFYMAEKRLYVPIYVLSNIWQTSGWSAVIFIAALSGVSDELHMAAQVDGAGRLRRIWHIDLPWIMPTILTMLILNVGQLFTIGMEKSLLMQNSINIDVSEVLSTYTYKRGLINGDFSYASAIEMMQAVVNFSLLVVVNRISKRFNEVSLW